MMMYMLQRSWTFAIYEAEHLILYKPHLWQMNAKLNINCCLSKTQISKLYPSSPDLDIEKLNLDI